MNKIHLFYLVPVLFFFGCGIEIKFSETQGLKIVQNETSELTRLVSESLKDSSKEEIERIYVLHIGMVSYLEHNKNLPEYTKDLFLRLGDVREDYLNLNKSHPFVKLQLATLEEKGYTDPKLKVSTEKDNLIKLFQDFADGAKKAWESKGGLQ